MGKRTGYGASAEEVTAWLKGRRGQWFIANDVGVNGTIQSVSNALRHAYWRGLIERRRESGPSSRYVWRAR